MLPPGSARVSREQHSANGRASGGATGAVRRYETAEGWTLASATSLARLAPSSPVIRQEAPMSVMTSPSTVLYPARIGPRPFTAEDLWAIPRVGAPVPSPDGR